MKDKFSNLGPPGIVRRVTKGGDATGPRRGGNQSKTTDTPPAVSHPAPAAGDKSEDRVERWRKANKALYLERQREYMRKQRQKRKEIK